MTWLLYALAMTASSSVITGILMMRGPRQKADPVAPDWVAANLVYKPKVGCVQGAYCGTCGSCSKTSASYEPATGHITAVRMRGISPLHMCAACLRLGLSALQKKVG